MTDPPPARVALVTGAGRGMGRALALGLAEQGLAVGLVGRTPEPLDDVAARIRDDGGRAVAVTADVRDYAKVETAVAAVEDAIGPIDLLVNNAGVIEPVEQPIWDADPAAWWDVVETDLRGPFHCVRAVVPGMVRRGGGRVIDLNSGAGAADRPIYSAYCAAKAGLFRIGGSLHLAGYERGLRSFELAPGVVHTDMSDAMPLHADRTDWTPIEDVVTFELAIARGDLDAWSGRLMRVGVDTVESLRAAATAGAADGTARRLGVLPYGSTDPLIGQF